MGHLSSGGVVVIWFIVTVSPHLSTIGEWEGRERERALSCCHGCPPTLSLSFGGGITIVIHLHLRVVGKWEEEGGIVIVAVPPHLVVVWWGHCHCHLSASVCCRQIGGEGEGDEVTKQAIQ